MTTDQIIRRVWLGGGTLTPDEARFIARRPCWTPDRSLLENALDHVGLRDAWVAAGRPIMGWFQSWWNEQRRINDSGTSKEKRDV